MTCTILGHFYPTKQNFINVLASVPRKLSCCLSESTAKQQLTKRQCTSVTAAVVPQQPLMIGVQSYEALIPPQKFAKWHLSKLYCMLNLAKHHSQ